MTDTEAYDEILVAERELIDDYLEGALTPREKEQFEIDFLCTPERLQNLRFAETLKRYVNDAANAVPLNQSFESSPYQPLESPPQSFWSGFRLPSILAQSPRPRLALVSVLSLVVLALAALPLYRMWQNSRVVQPSIIAERTEAATGSVFIIALTPVLLRDPGEWKRVTIPERTRTVRLRLEDLGADQYRSYQVVLGDTRSSAELFKASGLKTVTVDGAKAVEFDVPAELMGRGDFSVRLSGENAGVEPEELNKYHFRITQP
ncbi:MAG TPA: hypothetical protein VK363_03230 [Pyrinomonadaceae bacterium]|nr:hypothetical protein [Pyrinomonadaceae bacterium]